MIGRRVGILGWLGFGMATGAVLLGAGSLEGGRGHVPEERIVVDDFQRAPARALDGWREQRFPGIPANLWEGVVGDRGGCLRAKSQASASAVIRDVCVDLGEFPRLSWRWKIDRVLEGSELGSKAGDDFAARVDLLFDLPQAALGWAEKMALRFRGGGTPLVRAINYVWAAREALDRRVPSPFTRHVTLIVAARGASHVGQWVSVSRDALADARAAFPDAPSPRVRAVALMTDSDDTGAAVTAWFDDLVFTRRESRQTQEAAGEAGGRGREDRSPGDEVGDEDRGGQQDERGQGDEGADALAPAFMGAHRGLSRLEGGAIPVPEGF